MIPLVPVIEAAALKIFSASAFLVLAIFVIERSGGVIRRIASQRYEEETIIDLAESLGRGLMYFSAILIALSLLGFSQIAASMGTAAGFVALGVSFALKDVLSDTVAGVYLAKDPDFNKGDRVEVDGSKGEVTDVGLRKSRIRLEDGNLRVLNNSDVEKKWTRIEDSQSS
ncbi:MAG: mechanosensitive ion channel family protein [Candidatus Nanosalina sp.]